MAKQEQANSQFLLYFIKFGTIYAKLRKRDEAFEQFKHYYRKLQKLNTDRNFMKSKGLQDSVQENKDQEVIARVSLTLKFNILIYRMRRNIRARLKNFSH